MPTAPEHHSEFSSLYPNLSKAFSALADACHNAGPLDEKSRRLVKVALAVGAGLEGAAHSAVRHAMESGVTREELQHVAALSVTTLGLPAASRGLAWIEDYTARAGDPPRRPKS